MGNGNPWHDAPDRDGGTGSDADLGAGPEGGVGRRGPELNVMHQEQRSDGQQSNSFRLEHPGREDGWARG